MSNYTIGKDFVDAKWIDRVNLSLDVHVLLMINCNQYMRNCFINFWPSDKYSERKVTTNIFDSRPSPIVHFSNVKIVHHIIFLTINAEI